MAPVPHHVEAVPEAAVILAYLLAGTDELLTGRIGVLSPMRGDTVEKRQMILRTR